MGLDRSCWFWAYFFTIFLAFKKGEGASNGGPVGYFFKKKRQRLAFFRYLIHRMSLNLVTLGSVNTGARFCNFQSCQPATNICCVLVAACVVPKNLPKAYWP